MTRPNFFIVGQPKSGTTSLYYYLGSHPQIFMSPIKEPCYFSTDMKSPYYSTEKIKRVKKNYLPLYKKLKNEKIIGEASAHYLYSKVAAKNIYKFHPEAKIIAILREPINFLSSYHSQLLRIIPSPYEDEPNFQKALQKEKLRKKGKAIPKGCLDKKYLFYSKRIKYADQLKRFYDYFPKSQIKVIIFDDYKKNNDRIYQEILKFLGIDKNTNLVFRKINKNTKVRYKKIKSSIDKIINHFRYPVEKSAPKKIKVLLKSIYNNVFLAQEERKLLDAELKMTLKKRYKREVEKISKLLNRNLVKEWDYDKVR